VAATQVAGFMAGDSAWLSILVSGALCLLAGACFSELNSILPSAAGIRLYLGKAFGESIALTFSMLYMLVVLGVVGAESFVLSQTLSYAFPAVAPVIWITVMLVLVAAINIRGIKLAGNFQDVITYGLIISMLVLSIWGLKQADFHLTTPLAMGGAANFFQAVAVGIFLFVGFEWVTPLAEEVTDSKIISHGMFIAVGIVCIVYALFTVAMTANIPMAALARSPIPQVIFAQKILGGVGLVWIVLISLAASITTFNAGLLSVSRFFYAAAREHALPPIFSRISLRYMTPWVAILAVFAFAYTVSMAILYTGRYLLLVNMAAAAECIIYVLCAAAVLVLRKKMADTPRAFKVPWGSTIPVLTILIFSVLAVIVIATDYVMAIWMAFGLVVIGLYSIYVVPKIKAKYKPQRVRRRREHHPAPLEEPRTGPAADPTELGAEKSKAI
jgi:amino acid transporter